MNDTEQSEGSHVGAFYDEVHELYVAALGDNLHAGYFESAFDTAPLEIAQERMTELMMEYIALEAHERLLDVGCGSGRPALRVARETGGRVLGISVSAAQVESANARAAREGLSERVEFQLTDVQSLPLGDATLDAVWAVESLLHVEQRPRALAEMSRVIKPGGRLAIADVIADVPLEPAELSQLKSAFHVGSLCSRQQYVAEVEAAGFRVREARDIGANTLPTLRAVARRVSTLQADQRWKSSQVDVFFRSFAQLARLRRKLGYMLLTAERL
jgi:cyclopropane fatty-acyl-phospholipid synthase-like methyltransferase